MRSWIVIGALALVACGPDTPRASGAHDACVSQRTWKEGDGEALRPGGDCIGCHAQSGATSLALAGTVYPDVAEPDGCFGLAGATVSISDAAGSVFERVTNESGNFWLTTQEAKGLTLPFHAAIAWNGQENEMDPRQSEGSCNACHTATGADGAPGRVALDG